MEATMQQGTQRRVRVDHSGARAAPSARTEGDGRTMHDGGEKLANFLGWFSLGLGVAQLASPGSVNRLIGVRDDQRSRRAQRAVGVREVAAGVGILAQDRPTPWLWSRVAGDMLDLAMLGRSMNRRSRERDRTGLATAAVLGLTALDVLTAQRMTAEQRGTTAERARHEQAGVHVRRSITINRPLEEVYGYWRQLENLPHIMRHLESVRVIDQRRSHWKAKAPAGASVEWDAEIVEERPNELISWRSMGKADVENAGTVRFVRAPGGRGTEIHVDLRYSPPAGRLGAAVAKLFREEPSAQMLDDLRRFKQEVETGEVVLSDATAVPGPHAAQPPDRPVRADA